MYQWIRPQIAVPTHGERRHLLEHARFAKQLQIAQAYPPQNGEMVRLAPGRVAAIDEVPSGRLYVDGDAIMDPDSGVLQDRMRLAANGMIMVAITIDDHGRIKAGPDIRARGLSDADGGPANDRLEQLADIAEEAFERLSKAERRDEEVAEGAVMRAVRKACRRVFGKQPIVDVVVMTA